MPSGSVGAAREARVNIEARVIEKAKLRLGKVGGTEHPARRPERGVPIAAGQASVAAGQGR
jgi:hypothetical protein